MSVSVGYDPRAERELRRLPAHVRERLHALTIRLGEDPLEGKALKGKLSGYRSVRVGEYRAIYAFYLRQQCVVIHDIAHRSGVYR